LILTTEEVWRESSFESMIIAINALLFVSDFPNHLIDSFMQFSAAAIPRHNGFKLFWIERNSFSTRIIIYEKYLLKLV